MPGFIIGEGGGLENRGPHGTIEVARSHRWYISIDQLADHEAIQFYAHTCDRPVSEQDRIVMHHGFNEIYMPGKIRWQPVEIKYYEVIDDTDQTLLILDKWWNDIYSIKRHALKHANIGKLKKDVDIYILDGKGNKVWQHKLLGAWPIKITPTSLDYSLSDVSEVSVTLSYDAADNLQPPAPAPAPAPATSPPDTEYYA